MAQVPAAAPPGANSSSSGSAAAGYTLVDEETAAPTPAARGILAGMDKGTKAALCVAAVVLVAAATTAIAVGVTQGRSNSSSSADNISNPLLPPPAADPPPAAALWPPPAASTGIPPPQLPVPAPAPAPALALLLPPFQQLPPPLSAPSPSSPVVAPFEVPEGSQALWWDEFDGSSLDGTRWSYETDVDPGILGSGQLQEYTTSQDNVRVADGNLYITALKAGDKYTSGRISTKGSGSWYPGMQLPDGSTLSSVHLEARIQVPPGGQGLWAALWMTPVELKYGDWPASGEIGVMHAINTMHSVVQGIHYGGAWPANQKSEIKSEVASTFADGFHVYSVDWERDTITVSIDGLVSKVFSSRQLDPIDGWWTAAPGASPEAPFDSPFYAVLNLAVGGSWPGNPDDTTPFPATMAVDYVRIWGKPASS